MERRRDRGEYPVARREHVAVRVDGEARAGEQVDDALATGPHSARRPAAMIWSGVQKGAVEDVLIEEGVAALCLPVP